MPTDTLGRTIPERPRDWPEVLTVGEGLEWQDTAHCRGLNDLFFSDDHTEQKRAKTICKTCPVKADCREWEQLFPQEHGIWWGHTPSSRRKMRQRLAKGLS